MAVTNTETNPFYRFCDWFFGGVHKVDKKARETSRKSNEDFERNQKTGGVRPWDGDESSKKANGATKLGEHPELGRPKPSRSATPADEYHGSAPVDEELLKADQLRRMRAA